MQLFCFLCIMSLHKYQVAAEKAIKRFYERFRDEHASFYVFIKGIDDHNDRQWYVSLMLNRLMFCYFIQKKGFLDKNRNYLREKLEECKQKKGKEKKYSFYRNFLLVLFHKSLNDSLQKENSWVEIGKVPYLNGGVFDIHDLEKKYRIDIDDKAFEQIFDFFDQYEWRLDNTVQPGGKYITPDVIGYIFEKYINDRAQMGAYYTREDITDYISKNCIIPWLFDETARMYPKAFTADSEIWKYLRESGNTYIYPSLKNGTKEALNHLKVITKKIKDGSITQINDFITYNLNISQFAQDIISNTEDLEFLEAFYKSLSKVTIIDPTCGSGAFLIAAMNILVPLYHGCITRMRGFVDNEYFIYKSIILNNLYGVDIMKEAVEIAKLRLYLKLVATVDADYKKPNFGLEPLPNIDLNIRSGNTLIGFTTEDELKKRLRNTLDGAGIAHIIEKKSELNKLLYQHSDGMNYNEWLETHQPFHWLAEFYEIVHDRKGFDIIIGNPPYLGLRQLSYKLRMQDYKCSDLFGYVIARCFQILHPNSRYGFIVMHNLAFSRNFADVRKLIKEKAANSWFSFFARIPAGLFSGDIRVRNCIFLLERNRQSEKKEFNTTRIHRWFSEDREHLFQRLTYTGFIFEDTVPMFNDTVLAKLFQNLKGQKLIQYESPGSKHVLYFKQSAYNWIAVSPQPAPCYKDGKKIVQSQVSEIGFVSEEVKKLALLLLNGKLFFTYWLTYGDEFHVTRDDLLSIRVPFDNLSAEDKQTLLKLAVQFEKELEMTIQYKLNAGKKVGTYNTSKLWHLTDKSDNIFLRYWSDKPEVVSNSIGIHASETILTVGK